MSGSGRSSLIRFFLVWLMLVGTALFLHARSSFESIPKHEALGTFPREIGEWTGRDLPLTPDVLEVLGPGDFLNRSYQSATRPAFVDLFVAYYPSQRKGDTIHSPQNCMPGAGWTVLSREGLQIGSKGTGSVLNANRFVFAKGMDHVLVLYWYQAHGRTTPSEYWAKYYLVRDSIALHRTDGAMVRIVTPIAGASDEGRAESRALGFAQAITVELDKYIPR